MTPKSYSKLNFITIWIVLMTLLVFTYDYYYSLLVNEDKFNQFYTFSDFDNTGYVIKTPGCRIPEMFLDGPEIDKYMKHKDNLNCKSLWNLNLPLITSNLTALTLNMTAWATFNISKGDETFKCYYTPINRLDVNEYQKKEKSFSDDEVELGEKKYFEYSISVPDEFVEVICELKKIIVYRDYHIFVKPKTSTRTKKDGNLSLIVLGLDAVSRLNFHRQMPKTNAFLSQLDFIEMLGYNKVEDNTFPNLIPVLKGLSEEEFRKNQCWPTDKAFFDNCHFVWDDFKNASFETAFGEDTPWLGTFNYLKKGFFKKPTDHYLRPLMVKAEEKLAHESFGNTKSCLGSRLGMTALLDYLFKIALSLSDYLNMSFFWTVSLTHDYIEFPHYGDDDLRDFFIKFNATGQFNKTVFILMSDHGIRWGGYRNTYQGGLEDRLPMLRFILPEWFKKKYPKAIKNLKENIFRLTTPYDLHETLLEFIDTKQLHDDSIVKRMENNRNKRGISLFLSVPEDRTCQAAGIPKHYCACHDIRTKLSTNDTNVVKAADFLLLQINLKLSIYPQCAKLKLKSIYRATIEMGRDKQSGKDYELSLTTSPGLAKFEATIRQTGDQFKMVGSISRLNLYGSQSICVNDAKMKLFCYCIR